jgi:NlpC/P60 family putative phage cell wall peptidase
VITREQIVAEARTWLGTRWQHQAYCKGVATDCIGLVGGIALELGMQGAREWADDPALHNYGRTPDPKVLLDGCDRLLVRIPLHTAGLGDILVMAFASEPQHFAIVSRVDPMYLIHAYALARKVVENGAAVAHARTLRAYSYREVAP